MTPCQSCQHRWASEWSPAARRATCPDSPVQSITKQFWDGISILDTHTHAHWLLYIIYMSPVFSVVSIVIISQVIKVLLWPSFTVLPLRGVLESCSALKPGAHVIKRFTLVNLPPFQGNTVIQCYKATLPRKFQWNGSKLHWYLNPRKSRVKITN